MSNITKISVTGTKGKTTTVSVIAEVLYALKNNVLKVDTTGHFVNGVRKSTLDDSKDIWRLVPSVCPGRYLWEFRDNPNLKKGGVAVLECSLGCSAISGLGYRYHDVGVFLNVFEDHLGSSDRIKTKQDIAKAKEFVFSKLHPGGWAVFNADDELVVGRTNVLNKKEAKLLPIGITFKYFDLIKHLEKGGLAITIRDSKIVLLKKDKEIELFNTKNIPWTFDGTFVPSLWNLMSAAAAVYAFYNGKINKIEFKEKFETVRLDKYGGRLTVLQAQNGTKIIADYAHEKVSLEMISKLARNIVPKNGKTIGVVRLAYDRTDKLLTETGEAVGEAFDKVIIYDKIDGYWRKPVNNYKMKFPQIAGRTSEVFAAGALKTNSNVERIVREDLALKKAAKVAGPNDIVVFIVNDNIERSINFAQNAFNAEFV